MIEVQKELHSKMITPRDIQRIQFTSKSTHTLCSDYDCCSKWSLFKRRDWYDADEVDDFLDKYVSTTINALGHRAIEKFIEKSKHYIVIDEKGNQIFETDSRAAVDSAIDSIKRFKEELLHDVPSDFIKETQIKDKKEK